MKQCANFDPQWSRAAHLQWARYRQAVIEFDRVPDGDSRAVEDQG